MPQRCKGGSKFQWMLLVFQNIFLFRFIHAIWVIYCFLNYLQSHFFFPDQYYSAFLHSYPLMSIFSVLDTWWLLVYPNKNCCFNYLITLKCLFSYRCIVWVRKVRMKLVWGHPLSLYDSSSLSLKFSDLWTAWPLCHLTLHTACFWLEQSLCES